MKFLLEMALFWVCSKLFGFAARKSLPRIMPRPHVLPKDDEPEFTLQTRDAAPAHFMGKFQSFSLLGEYGIHEYESREFVAGDYKWRLIIYPDGHESNHISVCLAMAETNSLPVNWEVDAIFSIFLFNQMLGNYLCFPGKVRRFNELKHKWGISKLITKEAFTDQSNGYLVDDNCVFGAEVFVIKSQRVIEIVSLQKWSNPFKRQWEIYYCGLRPKDVWTSEEFIADGQRWKILMYPYGNGYMYGDYVSIYLECTSSKTFAAHQKLKVAFYLRLKGSSFFRTFSHGKISTWFTSSINTWGLDAFISFDDMFRHFIIDKSCCIEIEICVQAFVGVPLPD